MKTLVHRNVKLSSLGMGTTGFWSGKNPGLSECIRTAHDRYGIALFDTAEMYGSGRCESALADTLEGFDREDLFLVSKILPDHMNERDFDRCLDDTLTRMRIEYLDLYLLHWPGDSDFSFLVSAMHEAQKAGKIRYWGVSNFDLQNMKDLFAAGGQDCFCDQIFYSLYERGAEYDLLPFLKKNDVLPMSYSSLGSDYYPHPDVRKIPAIMQACQEYGICPENYMLKMNQDKGFAALFMTSSPDHLHADLKELSEEAFAALTPVFEQAFPAPDHAEPLKKI
jgi:diketogulonate reductase-like aldo/keto reductase